MNNAEDRPTSQIEIRILALEDEIRERQELLAAYRRVSSDLLGAKQSSAENNGNNLPEVEEDKDTPQQKFSWRSDNPSGAVRNAIRHQPENFTLNHIASWLARNQFAI